MAIKIYCGTLVGYIDLPSLLDIGAETVISHDLRKVARSLATQDVDDCAIRSWTLCVDFIHALLTRHMRCLSQSWDV